MNPWNDYGEFDSKPTKIPEGYKKKTRSTKQFSDAWLKEYRCKKRKSKKLIKKLKPTFKQEKSLNFDQWYKKATPIFINKRCY